MGNLANGKRLPSGWVKMPFDNKNNKEDKTLLVNLTRGHGALDKLEGCAIKDGGVEMNTRGALELHCFTVFLPPEVIAKDGTAGKYNPIDFATEKEIDKERWMNA